MPGYGGTNGPDGSKKTGDQGGGTRDAAGGQTGGRKGGGGGGKTPAGKQTAMSETLQDILDQAGPFAGYTSKIVSSQGTSAPPNPTADPWGGKAFLEHYDSTHSPSTNPLDKLLGYETPAQRIEAYQNNPSAPPNQNYDGYLPSFPYATPGYVFGKFADAALGATPFGYANGAYTGLNGAFTGDFDGMFTDAAEAAGASRGPQGPDVPGGGFDGRRSGSSTDEIGNTTTSSDANTLNRSPMAQAMETLLEYTSGGTSPAKRQSPIVQQSAVQSPFQTGSSQVVA